MKRHIIALLILARLSASAAAQTAASTHADPLEDIKALKQVTFVMKYGAIVKDARK